MTGVKETAASVHLDRQDAIATITLNRPAQGNAINLDLARALVAAAIACDQDATIRCVVLTGTGRLFCAGGDLAEIAGAGAAAGGALSELAGTLHMAVSRLARMRKPLLTLVNGPAAGAGMSLALLGDVVMASEAAHFTLAYTAVGLSPDGGSSWMLPRLIGLRRAQELILTNRRVPAKEAVEIGLITRAVAEDGLAAAGQEMAAMLAGAATGALGLARALLLESYSTTLETQMEKEARAISLAGVGAEAAEGLTAFLEKRRPNFPPPANVG